jgi:mannosyltransferase
MERGSRLGEPLGPVDTGAAPPIDPSDEPFDRRFLWLTIALSVFVLWLRPLTSSFWLDELGTWWVIKDGIREAMGRSFEIQGQSPVFYVFTWVLRQGVGAREWALRTPSVLFSGASAFLLYRMARRMVDDAYARIVVLGFVVWPTVKFAAADFRPYALATLLAIASTSTLVRWLDDDRWSTGILYAVLVVATVYIHYLFGLIVLAQAVYIAARLRDKSTQVRLRDLAAAAAGILVLAAPLVYQVAALWDRRAEWSIGAPVTIAWLASAIVPPAFVCAAVIGAVVLVTRRGRLHRIGLAAPDRLLVVAWAALPIGVLVAVSLATSASLIQERYVLVAAPAIVLLLALAVRSLDPASARRLVVVALAIASILAFGNVHQADDWRGSLAVVNAASTDRTIVLVQPGFTEAAQASSLDDPERRSFLLAPTALYPVSSQVVLLPELVPSLRDDVRAQIESSSADVDRVLVVTPTTETAAWAGEVLGPEWTAEQLSTVTSPYVFEFDRVMS